MGSRIEEVNNYLSLRVKFFSAASKPREREKPIPRPKQPGASRRPERPDKPERSNGKTVAAMPSLHP